MSGLVGSFGALGGSRGGGRGGYGGRGEGGRSEGIEQYFGYWGILASYNFLMDSDKHYLGWSPDLGANIGLNGWLEFSLAFYTDHISDKHKIYYNYDDKQDSYGLNFSIRAGFFEAKIISFRKSGVKGTDKDVGRVVFFRTEPSTEEDEEEAEYKGKKGKGRGKGESRTSRGRGRSQTRSFGGGRGRSTFGSGGYQRGGGARGFQQGGSRFNNPRVDNKNFSPSSPTFRSPGEPDDKEEVSSKKKERKERKSSAKNRKERKGSSKKSKDRKGEKGKKGKEGEDAEDEDDGYFDIMLCPYVEVGLCFEPSAVPYIRSHESVGLKLSIDDMFAVYGKVSWITISSMFVENIIQGYQWGVAVGVNF